MRNRKMDFMFDGKCISYFFFFVFMSRLVDIGVFACVSVMVCMGSNKCCVGFNSVGGF